MRVKNVQNLASIKQTRTNVYPNFKLIMAAGLRPGGMSDDDFSDDYDDEFGFQANSAAAKSPVRL